MRRKAQKGPDLAPGIVSQPARGAGDARRKPSYRETKELLRLPERIETLENQLRQLISTTADPHFYKEPADAIVQTLARVKSLQQEVDEAYSRWSELDAVGKDGR